MFTKEKEYENTKLREGKSDSGPAYVEISDAAVNPVLSIPLIVHVWILEDAENEKGADALNTSEAEGIENSFSCKTHKMELLEQKEFGDDDDIIKIRNDK